MSPIVAEIETLAARLSEARARELCNYAQYLVEKEDDEEWDRIVEKSTRSPKFAAYLEEVKREVREGHSEPMDFDRL
jgi:hypothetical protein